MYREYKNKLQSSTTKMDTRRSKDLFKKPTSIAICIPNTVVVPSDAAVDEEKIVLTIRLYNDELIPIYDATADISIEILDPDNDILRPHAEDYTDKDGTYKVYFIAPKPGKYTAHVLVNGKCINTAGYKFSALGQYSYNKRKHSFRSSPRLYTGDMPSRSISRMTTGMLSSMSSPRISALMSSRSAKSDDILYRGTPRTFKGVVATKPPSRLTVLDESLQDAPIYSARDQVDTDNFSTRIYSETITERNLLYNDVNCMSIAFDAAVSHPSVEVSRDSLTLALKSTKQIYGSTPGKTGTRRLRLFPGTIGTRSFNKPGLFYWEISVKFKILRLIRRTVLFEIGLARNDVIDKSFRNDRSPFAWVISGSGCHLCGKVCLHGWHNGQMLSHYPFSDRIPLAIRSYSKLHYGFLLDTSKRHWIVVDLKGRKVVAHFKNLVVSPTEPPLWPVFGIYNPEQTNITMEIFYGSDVSRIPEEALDALSI
ncbi:uncharacterized protein [Mytilus edulis]|uniref:uncharacterized protein n=1 Tax=Mytilus edulis TaxID=6550 RepID=UPI0039EF6012